jgi:PAS domain S-box-containing protein
MADPLLATAVSDGVRSPKTPVADRDRFSLLEAVPGPVIVQDARGELLFANQAAVAAGFSEAIGPRGQLHDQDGQPLSPAELPGARLLAGTEGPERLIRFERDGLLRWAWVSARRLPGTEPPLALSLFRDATAAVEAEQRVAGELRLSRTLESVALGLASEIEPAQLAQRITEEATAICGAQFGVFSQIFPAEGPLRCGDVTRDPRYSQLAADLRVAAGHAAVTSYLGVPVVAPSGQPLGGLLFGHAERDQFSEADERAVTAFAAHAATAFEKARLIERARVNEATMAAERARLADLIEQAPLAIAVLRGPDHVYELANPPYLALVGRTTSLAGIPIRSAFPDMQGQGVIEACDRVFSTGQPFTVQEMAVTFQRKHGTPEKRWFSFSISPVRDAGAVGPIVGLIWTAADITEQIRARRGIEAAAKALGRSERRFRSLIESTAQMVWTTTPAGEVHEDSPSWRAFTGQSYEDWKGFGWLNAVHPDDRAAAEESWRRAVERRRSYQVEYRVRRADGSYAHTVARGAPILSETGEIEEWIGFNQDISDRVRAEESSRESARRLRLALEAGRMGTWEYDLSTGVVQWSAAIERMHGIPVGSFAGTFEAYQSDLHPEDREWVLEKVRKNIERGTEHQLLYRIIRPDGAVRWLEAFGSFVHDAAGKPIRLIGVCSDVTERVESEEARNALRIQRMLEGISDAFAVYDSDWTVLFANQAGTAMMGLKPADVIGKKVWDLVPGAVDSRMHQELARVLETGQPATFEDHYAPLGRWFEIHAYPVPDIGIAVYSRDVTARRNEQALQQRLVRFGELRAEVGGALSAQRDIRGTLQACCEAVVQELGVGYACVALVEEASEGLAVQASAGPQPPPDVAQLVARIAAERRPLLTDQIAGYPLVVAERLIGVLATFSAEPLPDDTRVALASIGDAIAQGVERRKAELALEERARDLARSNADLEQFAYVASHDLQEPLRMVASYVQLLERRYKDKLDDNARDFIGFAVEGVTRMRRLIEDLLAYSRVGTRGREPAPVDVTAVVATAEKNLERAIAESGAVITKDPLPALSADEGQLVQVFQNLIGNAVKFRREEAPRVHVGARREGNDWVFSVRDNGIGIEKEYFDRIFIIFQRLNPREIYPGTGIGLAITKKIVERHGGRIWVESTPGAGSTISFTIPATARRRSP